MEPLETITVSVQYREKDDNSFVRVDLKTKGWRLFTLEYMFVYVWLIEVRYYKGV